MITEIQWSPLYIRSEIQWSTQYIRSEIQWCPQYIRSEIQWSTQYIRSEIRSKSIFTFCSVYCCRKENDINVLAYWMLLQRKSFFDNFLNHLESEMGLFTLHIFLFDY